MAFVIVHEPSPEIHHTTNNLTSVESPWSANFPHRKAAHNTSHDTTATDDCLNTRTEHTPDEMLGECFLVRTSTLMTAARNQITTQDLGLRKQDTVSDDTASRRDIDHK